MEIVLILSLCTGPSALLSASLPHSTLDLSFSSGLCYTSVRGCSSVWCEISRPSQEEYNSRESKQSRWLQNPGFYQSLLSSNTETNYILCAVQFILFCVHVFTCVAVAGWIEKPSVQTSQMIWPASGLIRVHKLSNKIHVPGLRKKHLYMKSLHPLWSPLSLTCPFDETGPSCAHICQQSPCFTTSSAGRHLALLVRCCWCQRQGRHFKDSPPLFVMGRPTTTP